MEADDRAARGSRAEDLVAERLAQRGWQIVARNWRCRAGELDIVALTEEAIAFVEVRSRAGIRYGSAVESVTPEKIERVLAAAEHFVMEHPEHDGLPWRVDIVAITTDRAGVVQQYRHLENVVID